VRRLPLHPLEARMSDLTTDLHLNMLRDFHRPSIPLYVAASRGYAARQTLEADVASGALGAEIGAKGQRLIRVEDLERRYGRPSTGGDIYGMHWGDPEHVAPLKFINNHYLQPLLSPELVGVEIGPGGGRWTRYLSRIRKLYAVDFHQEMLDELRRNVALPNVELIRNNGDDFPGIGDAEVDLVFSFDVFVHFELPLVRRYLEAMRRIMKPGAIAFIHYSDKRKIMAQLNPGFGENSPETMRALVEELGYGVLQEDTTTMWHSSILIFSKSA
jgi:SAM-dependent methyltransferase